MNYLILAPTEREYNNINAALNGRKLHHTYTVVRCGVGKALAAANAALAMARAGGEFDRIAVVGYAASTADRQMGDVVAPRVARYHDCLIPDGFVPELTDPYPLLGHDDAVVWTGDSFVNADMISDIKRRFGITSGLFDMEATAVCQASELMGDIPVVVVKMVSDVPEDGDSEHSYDAFVDSHSDLSAVIDYIEELK